LAPASKAQADPAVLEKVADLLLAAETPLIVTKYLGRNPEAVAHLVALAEALSIPIVQNLNYVNFPTDHPLYVGNQTVKYARDADVLFFMDIDVPWEPPRRDLIRPDAKIIHLERDPLFTGIPGWSFPADLPITACSEIALPVLNAIIKNRLAAGGADKKKLEERRKKTEAEHNVLMREIAASIEAAKSQKPINPLWLSKCIGEVMDEDTILFNETVTSRLAEVISLNRAGSQFNTPPAGHLGWALGAAVGAKLGAPDATIIAAVGDGAYMFAAPTACHFTAQKYRIPFLTVIYNNQVWNASISAARGLYPDGVARRTNNFPGTDLSPSPQFELTARACGAYAERVEDPEQVPGALERALKAVKEERRQALLNVVCRNPMGDR
jgi:acetolactate synthase-1/2/3 large subunit